jgi:hypothetical protein
LFHAIVAHIYDNHIKFEVFFTFLADLAYCAPPPRRLTSLIMSTYSLYDAALHTLEFDGKFPHRHVRITVNLSLDAWLFEMSATPKLSLMCADCGTSNPSLMEGSVAWGPFSKENI